MADKNYTLKVGRWDEVVSKPNDLVYLTETHRRGDKLTLDSRDENTKRLLAADAIVEAGSEDDELKAEMKARDETAPVVFASPEAAQGSGVQRPQQQRNR